MCRDQINNNISINCKSGIEEHCAIVLPHTAHFHSTRTVMYLLAFDRINKLDVFFSSCICGSWRFNCSKHSLRCARLFFSSLLWTSRVPALWMEALRCVPLIFMQIFRICLQFKCVDDNDKWGKQLIWYTWLPNCNCFIQFPWKFRMNWTFLNASRHVWLVPVFVAFEFVDFLISIFAYLFVWILSNAYIKAVLFCRIVRFGIA